ncbi:MAG: serine protease, partial [Chloroflexota bacterium]
MIALLVSLVTIQDAIAQQQTSLDSQLARIKSATVFIYQVEDAEDNFFITCVGSGTLLSRDGLILTNAHNTVQSEVCSGDTLIIAMTISEDVPPFPVYRAEVIQADEGLDLALLQITRDIDGRQVNRADLALPFVEIGDSNLVNLDETIFVVGYTSLEDEPIQVVQGTVTSFTEEPTGAKSWLKTSASIPGLMSGAGAYNRAGQLIAIPTTSPPSAGNLSGNCRQLQDTDGDRIISEDDICVPIGGFINAMRASNFARPLFRAASLGLEVNLEGDTAPPPTGGPQISRLFFASSVNSAGFPSTIVNSLPTGATSLYLFFDYANMTPDTVYELRVSTNNIPNPTYSLAPVRWSGGRDGIWYIGSSNQIWENGVYDFTLFINGIAENTASIVIGGAAPGGPTISDIVFGLSDLDGTPLGNGYVLPAGNIASARLIYRNMTTDLEVTERWFYEGAEIYRNTGIWDSATFGADGARTISIQDGSGLLPGTYRLELYINARLSATADFTIAGVPQGAFPEVFPSAHFATADTPEEAAEAPAGSNFTTEIDSLYAVFNWQQIQRGTLWTARWEVDGDTFYERTFRWDAPLDGNNFVVELTRNRGLPDGTYNFSLFVDEV